MTIGVVCKRSAFIYLTVFAASLLLSCWIDARVMVINPDAICYLFSAEEVGKSGLHAAMHLCPQALWPLYSTIIFSLVKLTHLSYTTAAFVFDGVCTAVSATLFVAIVKELGGNYRAMWFAVAVILLAHDFNILRQDIIRDHGFWTFYLVSIYSLLVFFRNPSWLRAFGWSVSLLVATLFRIEGAIFLLLVPLISWYMAQGWKQRLACFCMLNTALLLVVMGMCAWMLIHPGETVNQLGRVSEVSNQLHSGIAIILDQYQVTKSAIAQSVMTHNSMRDAGIVVFLLLISWYLVTVVESLSWIYAALVGYAWFTRAAKLTRSAWLVLFGYLLVNLMVTFGFFAQNHFLAKRYTVAFSLVLMFWVPFALDRMLQAQQIKKRILFWIVTVFVFVSALGGIFHFGHSKDYIRNAGDWLAANVPADAKLYSNDYQLMYYSQHFGSSIFVKLKEYNDVGVIEHGRWKKYDYLALLMGHEPDDKTAHVMQEIHIPPLDVFVSDNGDHVYIYKVSAWEKKP